MAGRTRAKARKAAPRRAAKSAARRRAKPAPRAAKASKKQARARKAAAPRSRAVARKPVRKAVKRAAPKVKRAAPKAGARPSLRTRTTPRAKERRAPATIEARKAPALNRERRVIDDHDDIVQSTPPSSLDLDRSASSARSGRRTLRDKYAAHTETGPALTGGDVDADWESAYSVGDEAPGGDNPTPDQDIVDDIGRAVGVEYQDNEELKGADKVAKRDKNRWELDPASSDDWEDR
jgi:hypothetical protein